MAKFTNYMMIMSGLMLLFYFAGLIEQTPNTTFLNLVLDPEALRDTELSIKVVAAIEAILASAIVIGFAIAGNIELGVMVSFSLFLFNLAWDFISVFQVVANANPVIATLLFSPILLLFVITTLEWWRGRTT